MQTDQQMPGRPKRSGMNIPYGVPLRNRPSIIKNPEDKDTARKMLR